MTFLTIDEAWRYIAKQLISHSPTPSRAGAARETFNFQFTIDPQYAWLMNERRALDPRYVAGELAWYLSGSNSLEQIMHYAPSYKRFSDDGKTLNGAYGYRWSEGNCDSLIDKIVDHLKAHPDTRRAVLPVYDSTDVGARTNDCPCTIALQFHIRSDALHMTTMMRSNDVWLGLPNDVMCFTMIQRIVAAELGEKLGSYTHFVGNLHAYETNVPAILEALEEREHPVMSLWNKYDGRPYVHEFVQFEKMHRSGQQVLPLPQWIPLTDMARCIVNSDCESHVLNIAKETRRAHNRGK